MHSRPLISYKGCFQPPLIYLLADADPFLEKLTCLPPSTPAIPVTLLYLFPFLLFWPLHASSSAFSSCTALAYALAPTFCSFPACLLTGHYVLTLHYMSGIMFPLFFPGPMWIQNTSLVFFHNTLGCHHTRIYHLGHLLLACTTYPMLFTRSICNLRSTTVSLFLFYFLSGMWSVFTCGMWSVG